MFCQVLSLFVRDKAPVQFLFVRTIDDFLTFPIETRDYKVISVGHICLDP
jgi:hypothetical protein